MVRVCQFCSRRLDCRSVAEQDEHEFNCVGKTQSSLLSIIVNKTSEDGLNLSPEIPLEASVPNQPSQEAADAEKVPRKCNICRKPLRGSLEDRQAHMMKCSNKAKLNDTQTYENVVNERNFSSDSGPEEPAPKPKRKTKSPKKRARKSKKLEPALVESSYFQQEIKADEPSTSKEPPKAAPVRQAFFRLIFSPPRRPESDGDSTDYSFEIEDNPNLVVNNDVFKDFANIRTFTDSQEEKKQKRKEENAAENDENLENDAAIAEIPNLPIREQSPPIIPADDLQEAGSPDLPSSQDRPPSPDISPSPDLPAIPENFSDDPIESNIVNISENFELPEDESCSPPFYLNVRSPLKPSNSQPRKSSVQKKRKSSEVIGNSSKIARKEYEMPSSSLAARPLGDWKSPERDTGTLLSEKNLPTSSLKRQLEESQTEFNILPLNETVVQLKEDALKDGDLVKYSKCGKKLRFHSFWIQIRCPQLKRADTKRLTFAELQALHDSVYSPNDSFSQRELSNYLKGDSTLEADPEVADLPLPSQNHMPKFESSQKSNSSSSLSQVPETQPEDMADISFISPIIRRSFDAKIFNEKKKPDEEKNLAEKRSNTSICISSEDEHNVMKEKENQLDFLDETGEPSLIIQTTHGRTTEKSKEGLGLELTEDQNDSDDEFEATPPWIIKHPSVSRPRIEPPPKTGKTGKIKEVADLDENDSFGNLSNNSETLFGVNSSSQELAKENTGALANLAASLLAEGAGTAPFSSETKSVPAAQERETSPDFEINSPEHNFSYSNCNDQFEDFNDIQMPDFYSQSQNANGSFSWGPKAPRTTAIPEIAEEPPIVLSSDEGEKTLAEPHDLSDPPQLDQTRLSGFNEKISFCQERQPEDFDLGLSDILEKTLPSSAPTTPQKQKKRKSSNESEKVTKAGKAGRSLTRKSISLHAGPVKSSFIPSPAQKAALEEATAKYQKMPKEDLIKECEKYGMKSKLSKTAMIGKLKEIFMFQKLHQNNFSSAKRVVFPAKEKLDRKVVKYMTQDRNISSEDEESGNQAAEAFEEISEEQAELNKMNRVTEMIQSLPFLHKRVVMYDVIGLMELESHCLDAGLQVDEQFLIRYCDKTCITFRQENRRAVKGNLRAKRKKRK